MNARLVYVTAKDGHKYVRAEFELTQCGGCRTGQWWTIGNYETEKGARIAVRARARKFDDWVNWCSPLYVDHRVV